MLKNMEIYLGKKLNVNKYHNIPKSKKLYIKKKNKKLKVWARGVDYLISLIETKVGVVRIARRPSKDYPRRAEDPGFESQRARHNIVYNMKLESNCNSLFSSKY